MSEMMLFDCECGDLECMVKVSLDADPDFGVTLEYQLQFPWWQFWNRNKRWVGICINDDDIRRLRNALTKYLRKAIP